MYLALFCFNLVLWFVDGQSNCTTPSGGKGECISIYDCRVLLDLVNNRNRTQDEMLLLQNSKCGFQGKTVMVCCPAECTTPEGDIGKCININSCAYFRNLLSPPVSQATLSYAQNSRCKSSDFYSICCNPTKNTVAVQGNNPYATCAAKLTAIPPDPSTDCCGLDNQQGNKIVGFGGNATSIDMYPWMALVEYKILKPGHNLLCGGALISARYVLTAAHCIGSYTIATVGRPTVVRLGEYDISNEGPDCMEVEAGGVDCTEGVVRINIETLIPHPQYTTSDRKNDIGLIRLEKMAPYTDFIRPICLPTYDITQNPPPREGNTLFMAGWGATENSSFSKVKIHVLLPYVDLNECQKAYHGAELKANLWDKQICAGGQPGKDSCKGDSGGPLMSENVGHFELHGIVNFGPTPCAQENVPGVYAKVFAYKDWILNSIRE